MTFKDKNSKKKQKVYRQRFYVEERSWFDLIAAPFFLFAGYLFFLFPALSTALFFESVFETKFNSKFAIIFMLSIIPYYLIILLIFREKISDYLFPKNKKYVKREKILSEEEI